jgi:hypothetical protein
MDIQELKKTYWSIGYSIIDCTTTRPIGIEEMRKSFRGTNQDVTHPPQPFAFTATTKPNIPAISTTLPP